MEQARPVKFNFDTVFGSKGAPSNAAAAPRVRSSYSSEEVETIRRENFAQGKADTEAQAASARAATLSAISQSLIRLIGEFDAAVRSMREDSVMVSIEVARKLAQVALEAYPLKEVEALLADCLHKLHREPRIVVRVAPACAEELRGDVERLCAEHAFSGRVVVIPEPSLEGADCRVEWADGGVERDLATTLAAIEQSAMRWRTTVPSEEI